MNVACSSTPASVIPAFGSESIEALNSDCFCSSLDTEALQRALESELADADGFLDLHAARAIDDKAAPSEAQWAQARASVFGMPGLISRSDDTSASATTHS